MAAEAQVWILLLCADGLCVRKEVLAHQPPEELFRALVVSNTPLSQSISQGRQPASSPSDMWWDLGGWVLLFAAIGGALIIAKATSPAKTA